MRAGDRPIVRQAFTLIELVVSLVIVSILIIGIGSAVMVASDAMPSREDAAAQTAGSSNVMGQIMHEVAYAKTVTEATSTAITFTVADRDGDAIDETIRYAWSGTPGAPLTRVYDGGTSTNVVEQVQAFNLEYTTEEVPGQAGPSIETEGPEQLFLLQDSSNSGAEARFSVASNAKCAGCFTPSLPADAVSWRITRVSFIGDPANPANGTLSVEVRRSTGNGKPSNVSLDAALVPESSLVATNWHEVSFANAGGLKPSDAYCIAFARSSGGGTIARVAIGTGSTGSPTTRYYADEGGGTWAESTTTDLWVWVWGTVTTAEPAPAPPSTWYLRSVGITLQSSGSSASLQTAVRTRNGPQMP